MLLGLAVALVGTGIVNAKEPIFDGLGSYTRPVTTDSPRAQRYFNQGLAFITASITAKHPTFQVRRA